MSYFICDGCEKKHFLYGNSLIPRFINEYGVRWIPLGFG